ncbi:MAG: DNA-protecting protein DprA [Roseiflexaceae bacterium]|nr:DNA-protecting protein DprA [Roseiflexaceae bacterium]
MEQRHAYLGFNLTAGIGPSRVARLVDYFGTALAAWAAPASELSACGLGAKSVSALLAARERYDLDAEFTRAAQLGVSIICIEDAAYPALLHQIPQPPPLLYLRGEISKADDWALAVVGTRGPSEYGREATRRIAGELAGAGVTIISGLALGIDAAAHTAALDAQGRTLAVLACGVDLPYPERNRRLADQIVQNGALISEYPLSSVPLPNNFPARNRLISGLARGTLVVEAGERSGALITVEFALEQGREVFAVPGPIYSPKSVGTHRLIRDGATLVTCAQDMLDGMNWTMVSAQQEVRQAIPETADEAVLLPLVGYEPRHVDELGRSCGLATPTLLSTLAMLELKGVVRQAGPMQYVLAR